MTKNPFLIFLGICLIILAGLGFSNMLPFAEKGSWDYWLNIVFLVFGARRLHDLNKSGWLQLIAFTIIGLIPLIIWFATEGTKKNNPHGNPIKIKK